MLAQRLRFGKPLKRARQLFEVLIHPARHLEYRKAISEARRRALAGQSALLGLKYLGIYLAEFFTTEVRRQIIMFHFDFLARKMACPRAARLWSDGAVLWSSCDEAGGHHYSIVLEPSALSPMEGESQLRFLMDGRMLCTMTFSILDGASIRLPCREALFIGGVQGGLGCRQEIRIAAKANGEIVPSAMLLLAAKALGEALEIGHVAGISSDQHAAMGYARQKIVLSYDALWLDAGATRTDEGFFIVVPGSEGWSAQITGKHRSRTRRKRALKERIKANIRDHAVVLFGLPTRWDSVDEEALYSKESAWEDSLKVRSGALAMEVQFVPNGQNILDSVTLMWH